MRLDLVQDRSKIKANPSKIGQAVYDILSKPQASQTVEETIDAMSDKYKENVIKGAEAGRKEGYTCPYYVVVARKKYTVNGSIDNVLYHKTVAMPKKPRASSLRFASTTMDFDLYEINSDEIKYLWTLPCPQDCITILKNKELYDPHLVKTIQFFDSGILD